MTESTIYLGNWSAPGYVLTMNRSLSDSAHFILHADRNVRLAVQSARVVIDSPDIYICDGISPKILKGSLNSPEMNDLGYHGTSFNAVSLISPESFALRILDSHRKEFQLAKAILPEDIRSFPAILTKAGDGIFSVDGSLLIDRTTHRLTYVYFYRNQFINMDSNLTIQSKGKTIDSISTPQIKLSAIVSEAKTVFSSPPLMVNYTSWTDSGRLFVNSRISANNEDKNSFNHQTVIDVYSLDNNVYKYSFYVPDFNESKMKSFQVFNDQLLVLYDQALVSFQMQY